MNKAERVAAIVPRLGPAQRRAILSLGEDWGPACDHQCAKRMWYGIRGGFYVIEHKHMTDNCWRLNDLGLAVRNHGYEAWIAEHNSGDDGPDTYAWDTGIAP